VVLRVQVFVAGPRPGAPRSRAGKKTKRGHALSAHPPASALYFQDSKFNAYFVTSALPCFSNIANDLRRFRALSPLDSFSFSLSVTTEAMLMAGGHESNGVFR